MRRELVRLAVVLCAAASLTLTLGMMFPAQFVIDTAGYRETEARTAAPIEADVTSGSSLARDLQGQRVLLASTILTTAFAADRAVLSVDLWSIASDRIDFGLTLMPDSTRVAGDERNPRDLREWIDISVDIAHGLNLSPGDKIGIVTGPDSTAELTVRGIYAVRAMATDGVAQISARTASKHFPPEAVKPTQMLTTASPQSVTDLLTSEPWRSMMLAGNYTEPFAAEAQEDLLARAEDQSIANLSLVLTVSIIAFAALLSITIGESVGLFRLFRPRAEILSELGLPLRVAYRALVAATSAVILGCTLVGSALGTAAYAAGFAGPALPPSLVSSWWIATGSGMVAGLIATASVAFLQIRKLTR